MGFLELEDANRARWSQKPILTLYLMGFLGLGDANSERDLGAGILRCWRGLCLSWITDFSFIARQKRMTTGSRTPIQI